MSELKRGNKHLKPTNMEEKLADLEPPRLKWAKSLKNETSPAGSSKADTKTVDLTKSKEPAPKSDGDQTTPVADKKRGAPDTPDSNAEPPKTAKKEEGQSASSMAGVQVSHRVSVAGVQASTSKANVFPQPIPS